MPSTMKSFKKSKNRVLAVNQSHLIAPPQLPEQPCKEETGFTEGSQTAGQVTGVASLEPNPPSALSPPNAAEAAWRLRACRGPENTAWQLSCVSDTIRINRPCSLQTWSCDRY